MATEGFEGGSAGAEILSTNSIFNPLFGAPEFTTVHHGGTLGGTGGDGLFFDPGSSSMVYYLDNAPSAEVWALCDNGVGSGQKNVLQEIFGSVTHTNSGTMFNGIEYDAPSDKLRAFYFDEFFGFQEVDLVSGVEARGWLLLQSWATSQTTRNYKVYATDATTLLADLSVTIFDPATLSGSQFTTGYSLGVMSQAKGAAFDVTVDDFSCPIQAAAPRKPILRVHPRSDGRGTSTVPNVIASRSQQASNRTAGGYL